jgi:hypothetical protein
MGEDVPISTFDRIGFTFDPAALRREFPTSSFTTSKRGRRYRTGIHFSKGRRTSAVRRQSNRGGAIRGRYPLITRGELNGCLHKTARSASTT